MDPVSTNAPEAYEGAETIRVGVVLESNPERKDCVVVREGGCGVDYKQAKDENVKSFSFDQVVDVEEMETVHPELLQPLIESTSRGYNGALLICGASTETMKSLIDQTIIRQIIARLFGSLMSRGNEELLISVSFLQFHPDGSAVDLLSFNKHTQQIVTHPVLGSFVGGVCEVCVHSAEEACTVYETCRENMKTKAGSMSSRCSSLFSVAVERKLHPDELESDVSRSRLQLFSLAGGASRTDLRGVSPLVKVLDQIPASDATTSFSVLHSLLNEALTGNCRTVLVYHIKPQGVFDEETRSALELAQRVRTLVTKATVDRWSPKAAEQEIRDNITELRSLIMSRGGSEGDSIYRLAELTQNLQVVKNQSWEKRREESGKRSIKIKSCDPSSSRQQFSADTDHRESSQTMQDLQDQLRQEMEEHIKEGKGSVEKVRERILRIQQLKDALREEALRNGGVTGNSPLSQQFNDQSQLEYNKAQERRRQLQEDHGRLIQEEVEKMEQDLANEQPPTEGPQRELLVLTRERKVLVLQVEALRAEALQAERDLQDQYHKHQTEMHCLREESLQVFRVFRQVSEEQRKISESRYRGVLLEAVQDAIYLSAQNQQLQADNKQLRKALGEIKDALAVRGDPIAELITQ